MKENYTSFRFQECSWIQISKILSDTTLIMLERIMHLVIILSLVKCRFQNHWSDGKPNAKVWTVYKLKLIYSKSKEMSM